MPFTQSSQIRKATKLTWSPLNGSFTLQSHDGFKLAFCSVTNPATIDTGCNQRESAAWRQHTKHKKKKKVKTSFACAAPRVQLKSSYATKRLLRSSDNSNYSIMFPSTHRLKISISSARSTAHTQAPKCTNTIIIERCRCAKQHRAVWRGHIIANIFEKLDGRRAVYLGNHRKKKTKHRERSVKVVKSRTQITFQLFFSVFR